MPEDQLYVVESFRSRPWRTVAIVAATTVCFASVGAVRRHALRVDAVQSWAARSSVIARLSSTTASNWLTTRRGDTRLLALSAGRSPELFGIPTPGQPPPTSARLAEMLSQSLTMLSQLHSYTTIWLFDRQGNVLGTTSAQPPPAAARRAAIASLTTDSGQTAGPFPAGPRSLTVAFAQRVIATPPKTGHANPAAGQVIGAVVLTSDAAPLLTELAAWQNRTGTEATSLVVGADDSVYEFTLTPDRRRGVIVGAWAKTIAPRSTRAAFAARSDTTAAVTGSRVEFATRIDGLPWALRRRESTDVVFASVDARLATEMSTAAAIIFMIVIIVIARRQTSRERKHQETAESEFRYRLLADNATDVIARHAPDGHIVYVSPAVQAILGYRPRQLEGTHLSELSNDEDAVTMDHILDQLRVTNGAYRAEHRLRHANGRYVWLETTGRAIRDPVWGNVTELVTASRDIDARKEAESALRASEEEYRVLFDANPLPMWAFDADTCRFVAVNDAAVSHYGYSREEFLEKTIYDIRPAEDVLDVQRNVALVREGVKEIHGARHRKKDGSVIVVDMTIHEVRLGERATWLVLVKDVTEAVRTAAALRESNEFVRALFDSSPVAIMATDMDLHVVQWNGAAERLFGWTAEEVIGKPYPLASERMLPELERSRARALSEGRFIDMHVQRIHRNGALVDVSLSAGVIRDAQMQPSGFVLLAADLSERARLESQLRHAQKMDAVGQLAGGVAHDFNNLLTVVTGYAGILLSELPKDESIRPDIEEIMGAADRAGVLTRQLLAFSRQQMLEPRVLDLNEVVEGMEQMLRRVLPADIKVTTALDPSIGWVNADPGQLEQVLMNLIVNARDAMPEGGELTIETMDVRLDGMDGGERADAVPGDYVMLAVSDTGTGITKTAQSRIFEPFFTTKERGKGTGLGLSTAHGIITQSGGYLTVYSEPDLGATFKVYLPRVQSGAEADVVDTSPRTVTRGAEAILLVEDDDAVRVTATRILERAGYTIYSAADGSEALAIHDRIGSRIDLVLTDMIMPEMSGRELVARIRERQPNIAVLVMSGYTEQTSMRQSLVDSGSAFIQKPFTPEGLSAKVREALNTAEIAHSS